MHRLMLGASLAILSFAAADASAQDVIMRRPLKSVHGTSTPSTATPTPSGAISPTPPATTSPTPTPTATGTTSDSPVMYVASSQCDVQYDDDSNYLGGTLRTACYRESFDGPYVAGTSYPSDEEPASLDQCASQTNDARFREFASRWAYEYVSPANVMSVATRDGQSCTGDGTSGSLTGGICGASGPTCKTVYYAQNNLDDPRVIEVDDADPSACTTAQTYDAEQRSVLARQGLLPSSPTLAQTCTSPDVYGTHGQCGTTVHYDAGWPQTGSATVTSGFKAACYAVFNAGDPDTLTTQQVDLANCVNQHPTAAQAAILAGLAPDLQDYYAYDRTCPATGGVNVHYQRDEENAYDVQDVPHNTDDSSDSVTVTFDTHYVCSDAADYWSDPVTQQIASTYSSADEPCHGEKAADIEVLKNPNETYGSVTDVYTDAGYQAIAKDPAVCGKTRGAPGLSLTVTGTATVQDREDASLIHITAEMLCLAPL